MLQHAILDHIFVARHAAINVVLAQAGRDAGYTALLEQVVPVLGLRKRKRDGRIIFEEARLDIEFFGHPTAHDRLLDGTVRHPAAKRIVRRAALYVGAAAADGVETKEKRYPPRGAGLSSRVRLKRGVMWMLSLMGSWQT